MTRKHKVIKPELTEEQISEKMMLRQLREEARKEKFYAFIIKYKKSLITAIILIIIAFIGFSIHANYQENKNKKYSKLLHQFLVHADARENEAAIKILEDIKNDKAAPPDLQALAMIKYASILVEENKFEGATELFLQVNENGRVDIYLKEYAGLLALKTMVDSDDPKFAKKIEKLIAKLEKENVILKAPVIEQKAIFNWMQNKPLIAKKIFETLALDPESSSDLRKRANEFIKIINDDQKQKSY